jgi:hypothetical protein
LVKWHRAVNEIRYKDTELELLKEMADEYNPIFHNHVRKYCEEVGIDLEALKQKPGLSMSKGQKKEQPIEGEDAARLLEDGEHADDNPEEPEGEEEKSPRKVEEHEMHDIFKKLFKKLAVHLHPDKVMGLTDEERNDRLEMFKNAKQALDDERYFFLLDLSDRFNITLPSNYRQQTRWMKSRSIELDSEIAALKSSFNYAYADCDSDEQREKLVVAFLKQVYGL